MRICNFLNYDFSFSPLRSHLLSSLMSENIHITKGQERVTKEGSAGGQKLLGRKQTYLKSFKALDLLN